MQYPDKVMNWNAKIKLTILKYIQNSGKGENSDKKICKNVNYTPGKSRSSVHQPAHLIYCRQQPIINITKDPILKFHFKIMENQIKQSKYT